MMEAGIDFLVGGYGFHDCVDQQVLAFFDSLLGNCNLEQVNLFCAERSCRPLLDDTKKRLRSMNVNVLSCPLPPYESCREDTGKFCDWMVNNSGKSPWIVLSHFDVMFTGDYLSYIKSMMDSTDMVGEHHDGIVAIRRDVYDTLQVGFCGIDLFTVYRNQHGELHLAAKDYPYKGDYAGYCLSLDVGELLSLRLGTLRMRHTWFMKDNDIGKSDLFFHTRRGSGHGLEEPLCSQ